MSSGRTGTRASSRPVASRSAATIAAVETTVGGSPTPFKPYGAVRLGVLDQLGHDRRHVEERGDEVVGEARVRDRAVARLDLLHERESEALRGSALDLPFDGRAAERLADVLCRSDPDDARETELDVHLDDDTHRRHRESHVRLAVRDLPCLGIERERARMAVDPLDVDDAFHPVSFLERRPTRGLHGARCHPRHARRRGRASRSHVRSRSGRKRDVVRTELEACDLEDDVADALTYLRRGAVHLSRAVLARARRARRSSRRTPPSSRCS